MTMRTLLKILGTLALMVISGGIAFGAAVLFLMELGLRVHGNFEYYGPSGPSFGSLLGVVFIFGSGAIGFVAPAILMYYLNKNSWRLSLRSLFMAITLIAVLFGAIALLMRIAPS